MDLMERVKAECKKHEKCKECPFSDDCSFCTLEHPPVDWDIESIRKALGEASDKASDKEEIVVPDAITTEAVKHDAYYTASTINRIIGCIEQIKEGLNA